MAGGLDLANLKLNRETVQIFGLFFMLGFTPFTFVNAVFSEVSVWKYTTPEGSNVGTVMGSAFNVAIPFMIVYVYLSSVRHVSDKWMVTVLSIVEMIGLTAVGIWWRTTATVGSHTFSPFIWLASFLAGLVGSVLVVVLFGFSGKYVPIATSSMSAGMTGSGVLASLLNVIQTHTKEEADHEFAFGITPFFLITVSFVALGLMSLFLILKYDVGLIPTSMTETLLRAEDFVESADEKRATELIEITSTEPPSKGHTPETVNWKMLIKVAWRPCLTNLCSSTLIYFLNPGLYPYLTASTQVVAIIGFVQQAANMIGRFIVSLVPFSLTFEITILQALVTSYLIVVAVLPHFPVNWPLIPAVGLASILNGFVTTRVQFDADANAVRLGCVAEGRRARRYASACNQLGSLLGSYLNLFVAVALHGFAKKVN